MKSLIVNADDFGQTPGVNDGIIEAHRRGIVTSATVMANGAAFDQAVRLAFEHPNLGVGVHLNLVEGRPLCPRERVPTLVRRDGRFPTKFGLLRRHLAGRLKLDELRLEIEEQIDRVRSAGLTPTHVDSHQHIHAYPPFFATIAQAVESRGIRAIRVPYERWSWRDAFTCPRGLLRTIALNSAASRCRPALRRSSLVSTDSFWGTTHTGRLTVAGLTDWLRRLDQPTAELMVHPGICDAALRQTGTRLLSSRDQELAVLTHSDVARAIASLEIRLIHYGDLVHDRAAVSSDANDGNRAVMTTGTAPESHTRQSG